MRLKRVAQLIVLPSNIIPSPAAWEPLRSSVSRTAYRTRSCAFSTCIRTAHSKDCRPNSVATDTARTSNNKSISACRFRRRRQVSLTRADICNTNTCRRHRNNGQYSCCSPRDPRRSNSRACRPLAAQCHKPARFFHRLARHRLARASSRRNRFHCSTCSVELRCVTVERTRNGNNNTSKRSLSNLRRLSNWWLHNSACNICISRRV